ncbi:MAG: class I SAM-dependent methyltransferase [Rhodocyclaceae bacterium]
MRDESQRGWPDSLGVLENLSPRQRDELFPGAPRLTARHLANCKVLESRYRILDHIPKGGTCAELGVMRGNFSEHILLKTQPARLHLIDINPGAMGFVAQRFANEVASGLVQLTLGDSAASVLQLPADYLDWAYIDGDHRYEAVRRDLQAVYARLKPDGWIVLNDYVFFSPIDFIKYGVVEAVNEFCLAHDFEVIFFALQEKMYNDVVLRRIRN